MAFAVAAALTLAFAAPAMAFDGGPHSELTEDSLRAEGFGTDAVHLAQADNFFVDYYEQAANNPFSGRAGVIKRILTFAITSEHWSDALVEAAYRSHFDNSRHLDQMPAVEDEWLRLQKAVWSLVQEAKAKNDPQMLVAVLGMSLHQVQDFYAHTNWVEPKTEGFGGGPDWQSLGFGSTPTWFDIPKANREEEIVYSDESRGRRVHGYWDSDNNMNLDHAMNKDWSGRPYFLRAAMSAYFASRQWIQAIRLWLGDEDLWRRAQEFRGDKRELQSDDEAAYYLSVFTGHWDGQGEPAFAEHPGPGGSLLDVRSAARDYYARGKTKYRAEFEKLLMKMADPNPTGQVGPVPSSQGMQRSTRFAVLRIQKYAGEGLGDPGPDDADIYANVRVDGQPMTSAIIGDHDKYNFPKPNSAFLWIKAIPAQLEEQLPVSQIQVEVKTADMSSAGTDDSVYLNLGPGLKFPLDKRLYDDFERGDTDTYSVPIDAAVQAGMRIGDITRVSLEKNKDGLGGGWRPDAIKLIVNGRVIYSNSHVNQWLHNKELTWIAPDFTPTDPRGPVIPVWINLRESDSVYGKDDEGDINPYDGRDTVQFAYNPQTEMNITTKGGNALGGRLDSGGDRALVEYRLETITPQPGSVVLMKPPAPPAPPGAPVKPGPPALPDLTVTRFNLETVTVSNGGDGAAGPFRLKLAWDGGTKTLIFPGLGPHESASRTPGVRCENGYAEADDLDQVEESNESNNTTELEADIC